MGKRFVGLDGLKHFWIKAKTWIMGQITSEVTAKIAEIVANAPEDLDTLKEIADWIETHANDASAMNTQITTNKNDIATLKTSVAGKADKSHTHDDRYFTETEVTNKLAGKSDTGHTHDDRYFTETEVTNKLAGKADKSHTHTKSQITDFPTSLKNPNALTVNGKTYDGSSAVNAGVQTVANGGTGATTAKGAEYNIIGGVETVETTPTDDRYMALRNLTINSENGSFRWTKCSSIWSWIQSKISSVLGLTATNYGGKASTAGTADKTVNDITMDITNAMNGQYVVLLGSIPEPTSTEVNSPYNWDIAGFFSIIRQAGHNGSHIKFEAGHGYSHDWTTYAYLDKEDFRYVTTSMKAFRYNGVWWMGLCIDTLNQTYFGKMTITYSRGLPATPTCILYNSISNGVANEEIYNSIQDIPSSWWRPRTIHNPTTFTKDITAPNITSLEQRATSLETKLTKAVPTYSASDAGKSLAVNSDGTGTEWVKPQRIKTKEIAVGSFTVTTENSYAISITLPEGSIPISVYPTYWASNSGVFSIMCYTRSTAYVVANNGTSISGLNIRVVYI